MEIGDKILCSNNQIYTLSKGDGLYEFSLVNIFGETVNLVRDSYLDDCINSDEDCLVIGTDSNDNCIRTKIVHYLNHKEYRCLYSDYTYENDEKLTKDAQILKYILILDKLIDKN